MKKLQQKLTWFNRKETLGAKKTSDGQAKIIDSMKISKQKTAQLADCPVQYPN